MRLLMILAVFMVYMPCAQAAEMTVEEAYKEKKCKQTTFNKEIASMSPADAKYLDHLFFVTDMAFRERMIMLQYFKKGKDKQYIKKYNQQIGDLLASFEMIKAPGEKLPEIEQLIKEAISEHRKFFNEWYKARGTEYYNELSRGGYMKHELVQSAHKKLYKSYDLLKMAYPLEPAYNRQSFYNHLCALDFI